MAYFSSKERKYTPIPIPDYPGYVPPIPPTPPSAGGGSVPDIPRPTFSGSTTFKLYQTASENMVLNKQLQNELSMEVAFKEETSALNPVVKIQTNTNLNIYNYCYIEATRRYYYIDNIDMLPGNIFRLTCSVDVLMSYKDQIKIMNGIVSRTEDPDIMNLDFNDGTFVNQEGYFKEIKIAPKGDGISKFLDTPENILIVAGGEGETYDPSAGGSNG